VVVAHVIDPAGDAGDDASNNTVQEKFHFASSVGKCD
jgi:hypothetical protein